MKSKLTIAIVLGLLIIAFVFKSGTNLNNTNASSPPSAPGDNDFLIGTLHDGADTSFKYIKDSLGFNLWHIYLGARQTSGKWYPTGWLNNGAPGDSLFAGYSDYAGQVQSALYNIGNHDMKALMQRPKIEYLCYGQRSDYQCEEVSPNNNYWFYAFNDAHPTAETTTDSGQVVIHCRTGTDDSGFVVKRLKANTEQCHTETSSEAYRWDSQSDWLIKPRIRIDSNFAHNFQNSDVCRIIVLNQDRDTVKNTVVKAKHFLVDGDPPQFYNGRYLEEFNFGQNDSTLAIHGAWGDWWWYSARGTRTLAQEQDTINNKFNRADIQVYWYGSCDMWIDYVRVDNDVADQLFKGQRDDWLQLEAQYIACYGNSPYQFYIELFEFNNIPCMTYVSRKIDEITYTSCGKHFSVMADALCFYQCHMSRDERGIIDEPVKVKNMFLDSIGANQIFLGDPYPLITHPPSGCGTSGTHSEIPNTLPKTSGDSIWADAVAPLTYDAWLQGQLDTTCSFYTGGWDDNNYLAGVFLYLMKHGDELSKLAGIPFIAMLQAHQWIGGGEIDREPTNEELNLMTNLAVSYGARGIVYWGITSYADPQDECKFSYGIMDGISTPRYTNVYGEPKWEAFKNMTGRLKTWGPTLMSFNDTDRHSYIYRLERPDLINETYFKDVVTYKPGSAQPTCVNDDPGGDDPPGMVYECYEERYIQAAVFKQEGSSTPYFMIVNRRCSPVKTDYPDGKRYIRIAFDPNSPSFPVYTTWKILDIGNDRWSQTFDKTTGSLIDLGEFNPGEGRLYKVVPVLQSGGTLLNDEVVTSGEEFTCEDTIKILSLTLIF